MWQLWSGVFLVYIDLICFDCELDKWSTHAALHSLSEFITWLYRFWLLCCLFEVFELRPWGQLSKGDISVSCLCLICVSSLQECLCACLVMLTMCRPNDFVMTELLSDFCFTLALYHWTKTQCLPCNIWVWSLTTLPFFISWCCNVFKVNT